MPKTLVTEVPRNLGDPLLQGYIDIDGDLCFRTDGDSTVCVIAGLQALLQLDKPHTREDIVKIVRIVEIKYEVIS